jgi:tetratricopeptide (TPR) repeat protein
MRACLIIIFFVSIFESPVFAQSNEIDSLKKLVSGTNIETVKISILLDLQDVYSNRGMMQEALLVGDQALLMAKKIANSSLESKVKLNIGYTYIKANRFQQGFGYYFSNLHENIKNQSDSDLIKTYWFIADAYNSFKPDSSVYYAKNGLFLANKMNYDKGREIMLWQLTNAYKSLSDNSKSLEYGLEYLKLIEKKADDNKTAYALLNIAQIYHLNRDYKKALGYYLEVDKLSKKLNDPEIYKQILLDFSDIYEKMDSLNMALIYGQQSLQKAEENRDSGYIGTSNNNLGNIYFKQRDFRFAKKSYLQAIPYLEKSLYNSFLCESYIGLARIAEMNNEIDVAIKLAHQTSLVAKNSSINDKYLLANQLLTNYYQKLNKIDSAFYFQSLVIQIKDSLFNTEKVKQLQLLSIEEDIRQKEIAERILVEKEERHHKLQLLMIGLAIPVFFLVSLFLSRKKVHPKVVEFTGIVSVLLFFEYITLWMHPAVSDLTNHSPVLEIIIFVAVAAIITPAHHKIQEWMVHHLTKHHHKDKLQIVTKKIKEKKPS